MRVSPLRRLPFSIVILCIGVTGIALASQQVPPPARPGIPETRAGFLVKAETRNGAIITFPAAPNQSGDVPRNAPVARNKGKTLLVLHFELRPSNVPDWIVRF